MRRLPPLRQIAIGNAAVMTLVLVGSSPGALSQRHWVAAGTSATGAEYRYDRLDNRLTVDLRHYWESTANSRFQVSCGNARGDRAALGDGRTVMHLDGTWLDLDDVVYCKVRDPSKGIDQLDYNGGAFLHRADP